MCRRSRRRRSIEWIEGAPLYRLRGKLLPLVFLDRLLMPDAEHKTGRRSATTLLRCWMRMDASLGWWWTGWPIRKRLW